MKRMQLVSLLVAALTLVAVLAVAPSAAAGSCYGKCKQVNPLCWECTASVTYTGVSCRQIGPCFCYLVDDCPYLAAEEESSEPGFLAPELNLTPLTPQLAEPADEDFDLAAALAA